MAEDQLIVFFCGIRKVPYVLVKAIDECPMSLSRLFTSALCPCQGNDERPLSLKGKAKNECPKSLLRKAVNECLMSLSRLLMTAPCPCQGY